MMSENDIDRLRCDPRCAKSDKPKFLGAIDIDSSPVDDDDDGAFSSATENAATETVAIAMDFNTEPVVPADDDDDDALVLVLAASRSLSSINSRVFSLDISSPHRVSLPAANDVIIRVFSLDISPLSSHRVSGRPAANDVIIGSLLTHTHVYARACVFRNTKNNRNHKHSRGAWFERCCCC